MTYKPAWTMPGIQSLIQPVFAAAFAEKQELYVLRLDLIHPTISGNKALKLSGWLEHYYQEGFSSIVSIGGPWSNHLHALSFACHQLAIPLSIWIKGHHSLQTAMLQDCREQGAQIFFYHHQHQEKTLEQVQQEARQNNALWIPMGGDGAEGRTGVTAFFKEMDWHQYQTIWLACGSGTTLEGMLPAMPPNLQIQALLPGFSATPHLAQLAAGDHRLHLHQDTGRFGATPPSLMALEASWRHHTGIPLDYCYTARLLRHFLSGAKTITRGPHLFIHTGGLQGNRSYTST